MALSSTIPDIVQRLPMKEKHFPTKEEWFTYFLTQMGFMTGVMLITGKPGSGKTTFATGMAWWLKRLLKRRVTMDFHPKKAFGAYTFFDHKAVLGELQRVNKVAEKNAEWLTQNDSIFFNRTVIFDESYKIFHKRRGMGSLPVLVGDVLKQWRHYQSMFMLIAPFQNEVDSYLVDQYVTIDVASSYCQLRAKTSTYMVYNRDLMIYEPVNLYGPNYWPLFNSFNPVTMRQPLKHKV